MKTFSTTTAIQLLCCYAITMYSRICIIFMFDNQKEALEKYVLKINTVEGKVRPHLEIASNKIQQSQNEDRVTDITDCQGRTKNDNNCDGVQGNSMINRKNTVLQDVNRSLHATENTYQLPNSEIESLSLYKKQH